jgi:RNA polymerase sigma-70 factor (ECF subfamily)
MYAQSNHEDSAGRAPAGDVAAFDLVAREYQGILLRFVRCNFPKLADAEDIVQESLLKAFENFNRYQPEWPLKTWLFTITHRAAISHIRRRGARYRLMATLHQHATATTPDMNDTTTDYDELQHLWDAAAKLLTPTQFRAIWLLYAEDIDRDNIARILGKTRPTTKLIVYRAIRKLRTHFAAPPTSSTLNPCKGRIAQGALL